MKTSKIFLLWGAVALLSLLAVSDYAAANPSVSVSGVVVNADSPVCNGNDTGSVAVTATVGATFDADSTTMGSCSNCSSGNNYCGSGNSSVNTSNTTTVKTYTNKKVLGFASDNNGNSNGPPAFDVSTTSGTGNFGTLPDGPEGKTTVNVSAQALEVETSTPTINYYSGSGSTRCTGLISQSPQSSTNQTITSSSKSASGSYLVDKIGPTATIFNNPSTIQQTGSEIVHVKIEDASTDTPWTLTVTATGPSSNTITVTDSGTFGSSPDGIKNETNPGPYTLPTACDSPTGNYTLAATIDTQDLCGDAYPTINLTGDPFTVTPGVELTAQTGVLSQLTTGDYGIDQCFVDSVKQTGKKLIVNNTPGSVHIDTIITTAGPCAGIGTIAGVTLTLTIPPLANDLSGFAYDTTGASPNAHIFVGDGSAGFDLHNGTPLSEVTVPQTTSSQTITIDLSNLNIGSGPGVIPASYTIFVRAHARFNAFAVTDQPGPDTPFKFSSSASTTTVDGSPLVLNASADYYISGNPTQLMDNLTGALLGSTESCNADGLFTP
ncbi:MAG: hypothetical protein ACM3SR_17350 [Ignavibacteriales bacterium]